MHAAAARWRVAHLHVHPSIRGGLETPTLSSVHGNVARQWPSLTRHTRQVVSRLMDTSCARGQRAQDRRLRCAAYQRARGIEAQVGHCLGVPAHALQHAWLVATRACIPNAPQPHVPLVSRRGQRVACGSEARHFLRHSFTTRWILLPHNTPQRRKPTCALSGSSDSSVWNTETRCRLRAQAAA